MYLFGTVVDVLSTAGSIVIALLVLVAMVVIHEFGHYSMGKLFGFKINEFAIGFGKPIFRKQTKSGEYFSIRPIPLGGYCEFEGEDEDNKDDPRAFNNQKAWKRLIVLFAGAFFNFVSAILIIALTFTFYGDVLPVSTGTVAQTSSVFEESDIIIRIDGTRFSYFSSDVLSALGDGEHVATVKRLDENGSRYETTVTFSGKDITAIPEENYIMYAYYREKEYGIKTETGATDGDGNPIYVEYSASDYAGYTEEQLKENFDYVQGAIDGGTANNYRYYRVRFKFFDACKRAFVSTFDLVGVLLDSFFGLFTGGTSINDVGGPITVISTIGQSVRLGIGTLMYIVCMISANLAVFNLLPIPALDGSRMVFTLIEMIRRKPVPRNVEAVIHFVGLVVLFAFAIFIDVRKWF